MINVPAWCNYALEGERGPCGFIAQTRGGRWQAWGLDRQLVGTFGRGKEDYGGEMAARCALYDLAKKPAAKLCAKCGEPATCGIGKDDLCTACGADGLSAMFESALPVPGSKEVFPIGSACAA